MNFSFLSRADWLNRRRLIAYPRIFVTLYAIAIVVLLAFSPHLITPAGKPVGTDFMDVWAAGKLALQGRPAAAYDYAQHFAVQRGALPWPPGQTVPYFGWHYPPMFLLIAALALWMAATLPAYLAAIRAIVPGRQAMMAALAFPGAFVNLGHGQNGFLTAGLLGGALVLLERRPIVAGILFGLLAYKPQFGLLIPLALLAGCHWRAIIAAAATVLATAALSWLLLGNTTWQAFFNSLTLTRGYVLEQGATGWPKLQSTFAAVRQLGGGVSLAYAAQGLVTAAVAIIVVWAWRRKTESGLKGGILVIAAAMATPYVLDYDLIVLALPVAWLVALGLRGGFLPWEKIILATVWLSPLFLRMIGQGLDLPLAPILLAAFMALFVRRIRTFSPGISGAVTA